MSPIELPTAKISRRDGFVLGLMMAGSVFALLANLARLFHSGPQLATSALVALVVGLLLALLPLPTRVATLHPDEKRLVVSSTTFGLWRRTRRIDLSACAWVRAKGQRGKAVQMLQVELGTPGYQLIGLLSIAGSGSAEVEAALAWCARVADALRIENKGYREVW